MRQVLHAWGFLNVLVALGCSLFVEFFMHEVPCSLCLLQRASMLGIALGLYFIFRYGLKPYYYGGCLLWSLFGVAGALRQIAINLCKDPTTYPFYFFTYRMYTWAFLGFFASILGISILIIMYRPTKKKASMPLVVSAFSLLSVFLTLCTISAFLK